jgi:hypothetical protein
MRKIQISGTFGSRTYLHGMTLLSALLQLGMSTFVVAIVSVVCCIIFAATALTVNAAAITTDAMALALAAANSVAITITTTTLLLLLLL